LKVLETSDRYLFRADIPNEETRSGSGDSQGGTVAAKIKKVLVVEDSELLHNMYRIILKRYDDCKLVKALNGREALDLLATDSQFDLILLDINMPVMNGIEFLAAIKKQEAFARIPVIIISTEGKEADTKRGMELGASAYLVKPFQSTDLYELVDRVVSKHG
jgi:two-component system chemotaxis response regulator CheY